MSEQDSIVNIDVEEILPSVIKLPIVKVNREKFLRKELKAKYPDSVIDDAIIYSPAYAGIEIDDINKIAKQVINYETTKVTSLSFVAGIPGGIAMIGTVSADITQYFVFILRILQKLAYLYSFPDFELNEESISDETLNSLLIFLGVMFGVSGATAALTKLADTFAQHILKTLPRKALTKGIIYPLVKSIAKKIGVQMTKEIFTKNVSKIVPILGGVASGAISYATFKPCSLRLQKELQKQPICDPHSEYYKERVITPSKP